MTDNARPHRAGILEDFLEEEDIRRMEWPTRSPYSNPKQHACDVLGRRISVRQPPPRTIPDLRIALHKEWNFLLVDFLNDLITSMPRQCESCLTVRE